jgi:uncharacterized membrane protein
MTHHLFTAALTVAYPLLVFVTLHFWHVRGLGYLTLVVGLIRIATGLRNPVRKNSSYAGGLLVLLGGLILLTEASLPARLYPVIINLALLVWFGWSLAHPPPVIERLARLTQPQLPDHAVAYTRGVTWVWCGFFLVNGMAALYTTVYASLEVWTLYNGLIAYLLMGTLFGAEFLIRQRVRSSHED